MSKSLVAALLLIALVAVILLNNGGSLTLNLVAFQVTAKESLILLSFFITGLITGLLLKGK